MTDNGKPDWLDGLFSAIDTKDTESFIGSLTDDAVFRFGSAPAVQGKTDIRAAVDGFFSTIKGSTHSLNNILVDGSTIVVEGEVIYRRMNDSEVALPFTNIFELNGALISHYKIYVDIAPLFAE